MYTEQELLSLIMRLVSIFAKLQRANIAHRNIKPANLVFSAGSGKKTTRGKNSPREREGSEPSPASSGSALKFEDILVCNFELSTCFVTDLGFT